jgi:hypothetical protein
VEVALSLARKVGAPVVTRTLDLSVGGARVLSERPLRVFEELRFDIVLPDDTRHLGGVARVLRQDLQDVYALRFEVVAPDVLDELEAFLEPYARTS